MSNPFLFGFEREDLRGSLGITTNHLQSAARSAEQSATEIRYLTDRVDRLSLICMAMWSLMRDKTDLTEEDLMQRVKMLDLMDGQEDGKASRTVSQCTACNRPMNARHKRCIYCGSEKVIDCAFDTL